MSVPDLALKSPIRSIDPLAENLVVSVKSVFQMLFREDSWVDNSGLI